MLENWPTSFPNCEPVAHLFRSRFPDRWVRFHYLPGSKRYPEAETEYRTVLDRYNTALTDLAPTGSQVVLLSTEVARTARPPAATSPGTQFWRSSRVHEAWWHIYAAEMKWKPGACDALFRKVASDAEPNVMIVAPDCRWLFHPYDGGMDVILDSSAARDSLRSRFSDWLSPLPSGL